MSEEGKANLTREGSQAIGGGGDRGAYIDCG